MRQHADDDRYQPAHSTCVHHAPAPLHATDKAYLEPTTGT